MPLPLQHCPRHLRSQQQAQRSLPLARHNLLGTIALLGLLPLAAVSFVVAPDLGDADGSASIVRLDVVFESLLQLHDLLGTAGWS